MEINFIGLSPQALAIKNKEAEAKKPAMYPFDDLEVDKSFTIPIDQCNWKSLRICMYKKNAEYKQLGIEKQLIFIKHDALGLVEVARII